jgi:hypothetical protein
MLIDWRRKTEAHSAFARAVSFYRDWGVSAKVRALETEERALPSKG